MVRRRTGLLLALAGAFAGAAVGVHAQTQRAPGDPGSELPAAAMPPAAISLTALPAPLITKITEGASFPGRSADFRVTGNRVLGPWRHSARPLVVYYTGPHTQTHPAFAEVGREVAERVGGRFQEIGKADVRPSRDDDNGALLYPDGAPRVLLLLMPGGNSAYAMADLAGVSDPFSAEAMQRERAKFEEARRIPQAAFRGGMNYVGCCGGFFTASAGYDMPGALLTGWSLWPGRVGNIGPTVRRPLPDVVFEGADPNHPLVRAAPGGVLTEMAYNGGPIGVREGAPDTEYLGKYRGGALSELEGDWFLVAYRPADNPRSGRCVIATGHPEVNHREYLLAMALYAVDHEMETPVHDLKSDIPVTRIIGDEQLHFFRLQLPRGGLIRIEMSGLTENCDVYLREGLPPTPWRYDAKSETPELGAERIVHSALRGGPWFVAVYGRHEALRGARYTLTVRWD